MINRKWKLISETVDNLPETEFGSYREANEARLDFPADLRRQINILPIEPVIMWDNP